MEGKTFYWIFLTNSKPSCRVAMQFDIYYMEGNWDLSYLLFKWLRPLLLINPVASWKRDHDFKWKFSWYVKPWTLSELWLKEKILRRKCIGRGEKLIWKNLRKCGYFDKEGVPLPVLSFANFNIYKSCSVWINLEPMFEFLIL